MRSVTVFVASPSDVSAERAAVREVADQLNRQMDGERGVRLDVRAYETDARARLDCEGPQAVVNKDMPVERHDIVIGIFWMRFGTPIPEEGGQTGSEYEIRRALANQRGFRRDRKSPPAFPGSRRGNP